MRNFTVHLLLLTTLLVEQSFCDDQFPPGSVPVSPETDKILAAAESANLVVRLKLEKIGVSSNGFVPLSFQVVHVFKNIGTHSTGGNITIIAFILSAPEAKKRLEKLDDPNESKQLMLDLFQAVILPELPQIGWQASGNLYPKLDSPVDSKAKPGAFYGEEKPDAILWTGYLADWKNDGDTPLDRLLKSGFSQIRKDIEAAKTKDTVSE